MEIDPPRKKPDYYDEEAYPPLEDPTGHNYDGEDDTGINTDGSFLTGDIETDEIRHSEN